MSKPMSARSFGQLRRQGVRRLRMEWANAPWQAIAFGADWYRREREWAQDLADEHGLTLEQVAGVAAVLSPRLRWERTKALTTALVSGEDISGATLGRNTRKAEEILAGLDPYTVVSGPKATSFFHNLLGDESYVTIDTRSFGQVSGRKDYSDKGAKFLERWGVYEMYADCFRTVAREVGMTPAEFQASLWVIPDVEKGHLQMTDEELSA